MIIAMIWKEWREQRTIAATILVFGVVALALTAQFVEPVSGQTIMERAGARELMALAVAYIAGSVCGAMLLADDKEVGTIEFLDGLPCSRSKLWLGKVTYGVAFTVSMSAILAGLAVAFSCTDARVPRWAYAVFIAMIGFHGFAWGLFGGALARSTLGAVFHGAMGSFVFGLLAAIPFVLVVGPIGFGRNFSPSLFIYYAVWAFLGVALSAIVFTSLDRRRSGSDAVPSRVGAPARRTAKQPWQPHLTSLLWLCTRQAFWVALGTTAAGLVLGASMLSPDTIPLFVWPPATLLLGVLAGVTTMSEEQTRGVARFWAERRLPLGRFWLTKVAFHFAIACLAALFMFLPLVIATPTSPFRTRLLVLSDMGLRAELWKFVWLGLIYGFVLGHLAGMLFRKTIVASLFAIIAAVVLAGFLAPSVLSGGLATWQMWAPALCLLLTARLVLYAWATERVAQRGPILRALGGGGLALALFVFAIVYRVYEIPNSPDRLTESGYVASLPAFEVNAAGRDMRAAVLQFRRAADEARANEHNRPTGSASAQLAFDSDRLERVAATGWTTDAAPLAPWLERVFADDWLKLLVELDRKAPGIFEDPRELDHFATNEIVQDFRQMVLALRVRAAQQLAQGDAHGFIPLMRGGLAAVRTARFKGTWRTPDVAMVSEEVLLGGIREWFATVADRADLLRAFLPILVQHDRDMATGQRDIYWAEQVVLHNSLDRVGSWLPFQLDGRGNRNATPSAQADAEAELVAFAWSVPWERARRERLLRLQTNADRRVDPNWLSGLHLRGVWRSNRADRSNVRDLRGQALRRFACLTVALRLYDLDHNGPASTLAQLVPDYLPGVPEDPYCHKPLGYRVSADDVIEVEGQPRNNALIRLERQFPALAAHLTDSGGPILVALALAPNLQPSPGPATPSVRIIGGMGLTSQIPPLRRVTVPAGSGIIWSGGPDGVDHGGKRMAPPPPGVEQGHDWLVIVPPARSTTK